MLCRFLLVLTMSLDPGQALLKAIVPSVVTLQRESAEVDDDARGKGYVKAVAGDSHGAKEVGNCLKCACGEGGQSNASDMAEEDGQDEDVMELPDMFLDESDGNSIDVSCARFGGIGSMSLARRAPKKVRTLSTKSVSTRHEGYNTGKQHPVLLESKH